MCALRKWVGCRDARHVAGHVPHTYSVGSEKPPGIVDSAIFHCISNNFRSRFFEAVIGHINIYDCYVLLMNRPLLSRRLDFLAIFLL